MLPDSATLRASSCFHDRLLHGLPRRWINLPFVRRIQWTPGRHMRPSGPLDQRRVTSRRLVDQSASSQGSDHAHRATPAADAGDGGAMSATRKQSFAATARFSLCAVMLQCTTHARRRHILNRYYGNHAASVKDATDVTQTSVVLSAVEDFAFCPSFNAPSTRRD